MQSPTPPPGNLVPISPPRISGRAWAIVILCGFAGMFFYMDRQTLSVLKTTLKLEQGWSDTQYGWLVSVFMFFYTGCYFLSGRWIDRFGTRIMMPVFLGAMSLASVFSGLAMGLGQMGMCLALLGVAEAGVMPAVMVAIYNWVPAHRRGMASTIKEPLYVAGQILATPLAVWFTTTWTWRSAFFAPGIAGLVVVGLWWWIDQKKPTEQTEFTSVPGVTSYAPITRSTSYRDVLSRREIWGVILARLISDPLWFFLIYWEPGFLQDRLGLSLSQLGQIGWIPTAASTLVLLVLGAGSDWIVSRFGWTPARSRRVILQTLATLAPLVLVLHFVHQPALAIVLLCFVRIMAVSWLNFTNILMADLVPQRMIGTAIALMSAFGACTGMICNAFVGPIVSSVGYGAIFFVGACLHPVAAFILWRSYGRRAASENKTSDI